MFAAEKAAYVTVCGAVSECMWSCSTLAVEESVDLDISDSNWNALLYKE